MHARPRRRRADGCSARRYAGLLWSKQFYHYDVATGCDGDPAQPAAAARAGCTGRNSDWRHLYNRDVLSMPDKWEYPWFAAWDLAFHCVAAGAGRPRLRQAPARPAGARVVHAPQRPAPGLRVELRRRQSAGARLGGLARLPDRPRRRRGRERSRLPGAGLPQAAAQLHLVGQPQGRRGQQRLRRAGFWPRQHRRLRPLAACPTGGTARAGRRHGLDGDVLPQHAGASRSSWRAHDPAYEDVATKFFEHFLAIAHAINGTARSASGTQRTISTTT